MDGPQAEAAGSEREPISRDKLQCLFECTAVGRVRDVRRADASPAPTRRFGSFSGPFCLSLEPLRLLHAPKIRVHGFPFFAF